MPAVHPDLAFVLCAMAGHLFGYEAALAIDASARPLREARGLHRDRSSARRATATIRSSRSRRRSSRCAARFFDGAAHAATTTAASTPATAVRLASVLRYATGVVPLDAYQIEFGKVGTPSTVVEDLTAALTKAIEELTRPIDAIKHQAKTVTVGISRSDETLLQVPLVQEVLADRRAARQPHVPRAAHARRARPGGRRGRRLDALPHRRRSRPAARRSTWSTAAASRATSRRAPTTTRCCAVPSTAPRASARSRSCAAAPTAAR